MPAPVLRWILAASVVWTCVVVFVWDPLPSYELLDAARPPSQSLSAEVRQEHASEGETEGIQDYVPPKDLYIFWGKSSFKGYGALGRLSSADDVRRALKVGYFQGNHYEPSAHGHGKFITTWTGPELQHLSRTCCNTLVVPPMENDLPIFLRDSEAARTIQEFVSNGNRLILTGGSFNSIAFLNLYFRVELEKEVYDSGPFDRQGATGCDLTVNDCHDSK
eukprot:768475-Hanusia_phi.AAC.7